MRILITTHFDARRKRLLDESRPRSKARRPPQLRHLPKDGLHNRILLSFALAEDFGRDVRNLMNGSEYQEIFETKLAEDSQARGRWTTSEGGSYFATGASRE